MNRLPYINIHTHRKRQANEQSILSIYDLSPESALPEHDYVSYGIHPWYIPANWESHYSKLQEHWLQPDNLFVGECGFDPNSIHPLSLQETVFVCQAQWAKKHAMPVILHCVKSIDRIIFHYKRIRPDAPWILHGFRGNPIQLEQLLHLGFYVSFGIYHNPESVTLCPPNRFYLETDDSPVPISDVYQQIAEIRKCSLQQLIIQQTENTHRILKKRHHA